MSLTSQQLRDNFAFSCVAYVFMNNGGDINQITKNDITSILADIQLRDDGNPAPREDGDENTYARHPNPYISVWNVQSCSHPTNEELKSVGNNVFVVVNKWMDLF